MFCFTTKKKKQRPLHRWLFYPCLLAVFFFCFVLCTLVQKSQESRRKYRAAHSSVRSFARTVHWFACSAMVTSLVRSAALIRLLARSPTHSPAHGKVKDSMYQNDLIFVPQCITLKSEIVNLSLIWPKSAVKTAFKNSTRSQQHANRFLGGGENRESTLVQNNQESMHWTTCTHCSLIGLLSPACFGRMLACMLCCTHSLTSGGGKLKTF